MKRNRTKYLLGLILFVSVIGLHAQDYEQKLVVPLSKPGQKGLLEVGLITGSIKVDGYNGNEVIVVAKTLKGDEEHVRNKNRNESADISGLKKLNSVSFEINIEEKDNHVEISSDQVNRKIDLEIKVPREFSLDLGTVNNGNIYVSNVKGNHEISNVNGNIEMVAISGSVLATTVNGKIEVAFDEITPNTPMSFANLNKQIDVTLPSNTKATLKMASKMGDIYTDFDAELVKTDPEVKKSSETGVYKVSVSQMVTAKLNGGGPEFTFKNFNGDIVVRKKK